MSNILLNNQGNFGKTGTNGTRGKKNGTTNFNLTL